MIRSVFSNDGGAPRVLVKRECCSYRLGAVGDQRNRALRSDDSGTVKTRSRERSAARTAGPFRSSPATATLRAWLFTPENANRNCVVALHRISDTRTGLLGLARLLVENHYTVLAPDSRGHGESGGELVTHGLREAGDVHRWVDWLIASEHPRNVFGMGKSLAAGVLLQSPGRDSATHARATGSL